MGEAKRKQDEIEATQNEFKAEVMYESEGKTPAGDPFMTVKLF